MGGYPVRALLRRAGETVIECDGVVGIDWATGAPLTNPDWCGGPYKLVADYVESSEQVPIDYAAHTATTETVEKPTETITLSADDIALLRKVIG